MREIRDMRKRQCNLHKNRNIYGIYANATTRFTATSF